MHKPSALLLALLASCYSPDLSGVRYTCSDANPYCPSGLVCTNGVCQEPGQSGGPDDGGSGDGATDGGPTSGDLGGPPVGCKSGMGTPLGPNVFACPGKFDPFRNGNPLASDLCNKAGGYNVCASMMLGGPVMMQCKMLSGFFASSGQASLNPNDFNPADTSCSGPPNSNWGRLVLGCGRSANSIYNLAPPCAGATQALDCRNTSGWNCQNAGKIDDVANDKSTDGVLCCK